MCLHVCVCVHVCVYMCVYLVQEHQGSFERIVDLLVSRIADTALSYLLPPMLQIVIPQLVATGSKRNLLKKNTFSLSRNGRTSPEAPLVRVRILNSGQFLSLCLCAPNSASNISAGTGGEGSLPRREGQPPPVDVCALCIVKYIVHVTIHSCTYEYDLLRDFNFWHG